MTARRARNLLVALVGFVALVGVGALSQDDGDDGFTELPAGESAPEFASDGSGAMGTGSGMSGRAAMGGSAGGMGGDEFAAADQDDSTAGVGAGSGVSPTSQGLPLPPGASADRIIKDGHVAIEVAAGEFDRAFSGVVDLAGRVEGEVVSSQTTRDEERASGEVTIRVAAERFDRLLEATDGIGTVQRREVTSQDVGAEFVDLESRLRHLQAQERFYLGLLSEAQVVGDAIAINQHLSSVQAEMEQVQGRLRLLDERTTYSRLTIALYEPGINPLLGGQFEQRGGVLARAWGDAVHALQATLGALLIGAFTVAPLAALGLAGWLLWRRLRPRPAGGDGPRRDRQDEEEPVPVG